MKTHLFWGQKVKGQGHESTGVCLCTFVSAGFFLVATAILFTTTGNNPQKPGTYSQ